MRIFEARYGLKSPFFALAKQWADALQQDPPNLDAMLNLARDAEAQCANQGGDLATFAFLNEMRAVNRALQESQLRRLARPWDR